MLAMPSLTLKNAQVHERNHITGKHDVNNIQSKKPAAMLINSQNSVSLRSSVSDKKTYLPKDSIPVRSEYGISEIFIVLFSSICTPWSTMFLKTFYNAKYQRPKAELLSVMLISFYVN